MTQRREIERHRNGLQEIREIMSAMKTLAYMETRKLARFLAAQQKVVDNIETVAQDFLTFHSDMLAESETEVPVYLLIGTERGFCGDINHGLLKQFEQALRHAPLAAQPRLIVVGHKLHLLLENDPRVVAFVNGASIAEEMAGVLQLIVAELAKLQAQLGLITLYGLHHGDEAGIIMKKLLPPFQSSLKLKTDLTQAPQLNLPPAQFMLELTDHYLFSTLNEMLYTSLMAENHRRVAHLEGAVQHLDENALKLQRQANALRQEEITEEIEVILLSADSLLKR